MMHSEVLSLTARDGCLLPCMLWLPDTPPTAILQITHGMTEHAGRYTALAEALTAHGIAAAAFDLRGHGRHPTVGSCAAQGKNGWSSTLSDMQTVSDMLRTRFSGVPLFHLGFSLGSFLLREFLAVSDIKINGAILLGTGHQPRAVLTVMCAIVKSQIRKVGNDETTPLIQKLSFETYNTRFRPNRTAFDWLCSDNEQLDAYLSDPLCRNSISAGMIYDLLSSMKHTAEAALCKQYKSCPILLLSGDHDPVGDMGRGVKRVENILRRTSNAEVSCVLYPNARHDLLHEEADGTAEQARTQIVRFILSHI